MKERKKANILNQYTPDQGNHMKNWQNTKNFTYKQTKRLAISKQVPTRLQWTDKNAWQARCINNKNDPQKKHRLGTVRKTILLQGLNKFHSTIPLSSNVEQDTEMFGLHEIPLTYPLIFF